MDNGTMRDYISDLVLLVNELQDQVRFWQATAQQAIENTDKALAVIELQKAIKAEIEKAANG
jgi:uncharacterized protein with PhoU and TrkA domain